jgi:hypothetical protein
MNCHIPIFEHQEASLERPNTVISHHDMCRLSRLFNRACDLRNSQDARINEWLKEQIRKSLVLSLKEAERG